MFLRQLLQNKGGHAEFEHYRTWFRGLYNDPERPVLDILGRRVLFDTYPTLDDCAHVCYGGEAGHAYKAEHWRQDRAERIAWIEYALTQPNKIHPDATISTNEKYLLYVPPEMPEQEAEYYMVIVRRLNNPKTVAFVTAYGISRKNYDEFEQVGPRIYPAPRPKKRKK